MKKLLTLFALLLCAVGSVHAVDIKESYTGKPLNANNVFPFSTIVLGENATNNSDRIQVAKNTSGKFTISSATGYYLKEVIFHPTSNTDRIGSIEPATGKGDVEKEGTDKWIFTPSSTTVNSVEFTMTVPSSAGGAALIDRLYVTVTDNVSEICETVTPTSASSGTITYESTLSPSKVTSWTTDGSPGTNSNIYYVALGSGKKITINTNQDIKAVYFSWNSQNRPSANDKWTATGGTYDKDAFKWTASETGIRSVVFTKNEGNTARLGSVHVVYYPAGPTINTQPQSASYVTGDPIAALTVAATASAGDLSYQWYSCDDEQKTNPVAVGTNSASYTPTAAGFYYVTVTDDNGSIDSDVATIMVSAAEAPTFTSVTPSATTVGKGDAATITAVVTGNPDPTIQWYNCDDAEKTNPTAIDGATDLTLNLTNTTVGTFYYYAVATNASGSATSDVQTITVIAKHVWRTVGSAEKWNWSDATGDNVNLDTNTTPQKDSDEDIVATDFNGTIYEGNCGFPANFDAIVMYKFQRPKNGSYYQGQTLKIKTDVSGVVTVKFANTGSKRPNRYLQVNGTIYGEGSGNGSSAVQRTVSVPVDAGTITMTGIYEPDATKYTQQEGYAAFDNTLAGKPQYLNYYSVEFVPAVNVTSAGWATTTTPNYPVSFDANAKVYIATAVGDNITLTEISDAPAKTPIVVNAAAGSYTMTPKASAESDVTGNILDSKIADNYVATAGDYALGTWIEGGNTVVGFGPLNAVGAANMTDDKAFIPASVFSGTAKEFYTFYIDGETNGETTAINAAKINVENGEAYNLSGQKVDKSYKGIVIINGKKYLNK